MLFFQPICILIFRVLILLAISAFDLSSYGGGTGALLTSGAFAALDFTLLTDLYNYLLIFNNIL